MNDNQQKLQDIVKPIYSGKPENFHWVGFGSGSGTNIEECAKIIPPAFIFSDKENPGLFKREIFKDTQKYSINGFKFVGSRKKAEEEGKLEEYWNRSREYNYAVMNRLKAVSQINHFNIDLIVLGGYMRLITEPLLSRYKDKIINVHPSALPLDENNKRMFVGADAVYDALNAGEKKTRSSVIMVDSGEDHGEIITQGPWVDVNVDDADLYMSYFNNLRKYVDETHQPIQKEKSDWPALTSALELIANGRIGIGTEKTHFNEWRNVYMKNKNDLWIPLKYEGLEIK